MAGTIIASVVRLRGLSVPGFLYQPRAPLEALIAREAHAASNNSPSSSTRTGLCQTSRCWNRGLR
eukprot:9962978-Heterocapsa_arctica.AAC.1